MDRDIITRSEIAASNLLLNAGVAGFQMSTDRKNCHEAGNYIIALAERIKSERAVATMIK